MALIPCPECNKEVSNSAPQCPHCGFPIADKKASESKKAHKAFLADDPNYVSPKSQQATEYTASPTKGRGCRRAVLWLVVIPGLVLILLMLYGMTVSPEDLANNQSWVIDEGKRQLEAQLKDPDSVEYGEVWTGRLKSTNDSAGSLVACGYFNAKNGFGGMRGQQRFLTGPAGPALTDESAGALMDEAWQQACITNRQ